MSKRKETFTDEQIVAHLEYSAPIHNYYISGGLRHFCDKNGQIMIVMDDDDDFNDACIEYLKKQGIPNFDDSEVEEEKYIEYLRLKIKLEQDNPLSRKA